MKEEEKREEGSTSSDYCKSSNAKENETTTETIPAHKCKGLVRTLAESLSVALTTSRTPPPGASCSILGMKLAYIYMHILGHVYKVGRPIMS